MIQRETVLVVLHKYIFNHDEGLIVRSITVVEDDGTIFSISVEQDVKCMCSLTHVHQELTGVHVVALIQMEMSLSVNNG